MFKRCVDMEITTAGIHVTAEPERLVNGLCWNLNCLNPVSLLSQSVLVC